MRTKIILGQTIACGVLLFLLFQKEEPDVVIKETVEIAEICETLEDTKPVSVERVEIGVPVFPVFEKDPCAELLAENKALKKSTTPKPPQVKKTKKTINKYTYRDTIPGGELTSILLVDGSIQKRDVQLKTQQKTLIREITKTKTSSGFYVGASSTTPLSLDGLNSATIDFHYVSKKIMITAGYGAGFSQVKPQTVGKVGIAFKP